MAADAKAFLERWHGMLASRDMSALRALLAEGVSVGAPPYWQRLEGRDLVHHLLTTILETIEDFSYQREWTAGPELALEFTGHVGDIELQGIDLVSLDEASQVARLDVMIRPANAVAALQERVRPRMLEYLAQRSEGR